LKTLSKDLSSSGKSLKLFVTGRPHVSDDVQSYLLAESQSAYISVTLEASPDDITKYVIDTLENDTSELFMDSEYKDEIVREIVKSLNGMLVSQ
jgi:hypothetical protein